MQRLKLRAHFEIEAILSEATNIMAQVRSQDGIQNASEYSNT